MNIYRIQMRQNSICRLVLLLCATSLSAVGATVDFDNLISKPGNYQGKQISVVGVAEVEGASFVLYRPPKRDLAHTVFVGQKVGKPQYNHLDNQWVKITGIVDTNRRGPWDFACKIFLEHVQPVNRPPVADRKIYGVFFNEGERPVRLDLSNITGNEHTEIQLPPGEIEKTEITEGTGKISSESGKPLSEFAIKSEKSAPEFFEYKTRTFYFRIRNGTITPVRRTDSSSLSRLWEKMEAVDSR